MESNQNGYLANDSYNIATHFQQQLQIHKFTHLTIEPKKKDSNVCFILLLYHLS